MKEENKLAEEELKMVSGGILQVFSDDYLAEIDLHSGEWLNHCADCTWKWYSGSQEYVCPNCKGHNVNACYNF